MTSLRPRAQANAPAASYWLRRVLAAGGAKTRRVHLERGAGGGAYNTQLYFTTKW